MTFWGKGRQLARTIVRKGAFEWVNAARVAFSSCLAAGSVPGLFYFSEALNRPGPFMGRHGPNMELL